MSKYQQGDRGPEITRLEIALQEVGLYVGALDDAFGPKLEAAVRRYQTRRKLPADGIVDEGVYRMILAEPSPRAEVLRGKPHEYRSLALTASFETGTDAPDCFAGVTGDFDGQGISFGALQWNLGQGTLQTLLKRLDQEHPSVMRGAFGDDYALVRSILTKPIGTQLSWARTIQTANRRGLVEPWRSSFGRLGRSIECQQLQVQGAKDRFEIAWRLCGEYRLWSERGLALMFDLVVQNGGIRPATRQKILDDYRRIPPAAPRAEKEVARLRVIANRRAEASRSEFVENVRRRKLAIAEGVGVVHGSGYDLERQYLLALRPAEGVEVEVPCRSEQGGKF